MIARLAVLFGINSTRNATSSTRLRLVLLRASLVLLIPNSTANRAITYTNLILNRTFTLLGLREINP